MTLHIKLFGPPQIERDGVPVEVDTRKAIALLAYLAVTGMPQSRDTLAVLLWPESDDAHARAALRRTLSSLKALGGEGLDVNRRTVALDDSNVTVDVQEFLSAVIDEQSAVESLRSAVDLHKSDFMSGFALRDSPEFDDWQYGQSERLRGVLSTVLQRLVDKLVSNGDYQRAIDHATRWLSLDVMHEPAHRMLMELHAWSGDRGAALRQYRECVRVLDRELGVAPLDETSELYGAIKEGQLPPPVVSQQPTPSVPDADRSTVPTIGYPLVGRSLDLQRLLGVHGSITADGRFVVIEGEAGIGKTRLAEDFCNHVTELGFRIMRARCYEGESKLAYGPITELLRSSVEQDGASEFLAAMPDHWFAEAARLLPELRQARPTLPEPSPLTGPGAQSHFLAGLSRTVVGACGRGGVVFIDDVQWADDATLDFITYLVRRIEGEPILVLLAWRAEDVGADHRLRALLAETKRSSIGDRVLLGRLSEGDIDELVAAARSNGAALPDNAEMTLLRETEGVPLFVVEYLDAMANAPGSNGNVDVPTVVNDIVRSRLNAVSSLARQVLSTAAVIGRSFDYFSLREASGRSEDETVAVLEELIARRLVREMTGGESSDLLYDFAHEHLRRLVYDETTALRRRILHRRVADALGTRPGRSVGQMASKIARHYHLAGQEAFAAEQYLVAGEYARSLFANREALDHFQLALALGVENAAQAHEHIGDLQTLGGEYGAAITSYEAAAALSDAPSAGHIEHKLGNVYHRQGDWGLAASHYEAAGESVESTSFLARVRSDQSLNAHRSGHIDQAVTLAQEALKLAQESDDLGALAQAHNILGVLSKGQGDLDGAVRHLQESLRIAESSGGPEARVAALNNLALSYGANTQHQRAIELANEALKLCETWGDRHRLAAIHNNLADLHHSISDTDEAMRHLTEAASIFADIGSDADEMQPEIWKLVEW